MMIYNWEVLNPGTLKSDYFRIEIIRSSNLSEIVLLLKSDYFRIEIFQVHNNHHLLYLNS